MADLQWPEPDKMIPGLEPDKLHEVVRDQTQDNRLQESPPQEEEEGSEDV